MKIGNIRLNRGVWGVVREEVSLADYETSREVRAALFSYLAFYD